MVTFRLVIHFVFDASIPTNYIIVYRVLILNLLYPLNLTGQHCSYEAYDALVV